MNAKVFKNLVWKGHSTINHKRYTEREDMQAVISDGEPDNCGTRRWVIKLHNFNSTVMI